MRKELFLKLLSNCTSAREPSWIFGAVDFWSIKHEVGAGCPEEKATKCKSFKGFSYCFFLPGVNFLRSETFWINEPGRHGNFCQYREGG